MKEEFIGNYKILKKIGVGGMARVYLAVHRDIPNLKVVLKILTDSSMVDRFRQEADKLALLDGHPNICRIKHFFNHGDDFVIAMEYIDGVTLEDKLKEIDRIPIENSLKIALDVLSILESAHQKDIFHRDIKPSNIMIDKDDNVKIIDFGIAKGKSDPNLTIAGTSCGTPAYMAPEQFNPAADINYAQVDIYAVGTTLFHILTGSLPFEGDNPFAIRDAKLFNEPVKPKLLNPQISKKLEDLILKSLHRDPENRFKSILEMREAILPLYDNQDTTIREKTITLGTKKPEYKKSSRLGFGVAIIAIVILTGLSLYKFWYLERQSETGYTSSNSIVGSDTLTSYSDTGREVSPDIIQAEGKITLVVKPSGDVYLNNNLIGMDIEDTLLTLDTGRYIIRLENSMATNKVITDTILLASNKVIPLKYSFNIEQSDPEPRLVTDYGKVLIGSRPRGADIFIDGDLLEYETPYTYSVETGRHIIRLELDIDGEVVKYFDTIMVEKNRQHRVFFNSEKQL